MAIFYNQCFQNAKLKYEVYVFSLDFSLEGLVVGEL